jgi:hypothetical protein
LQYFARVRIECEYDRLTTKRARALDDRVHDGAMSQMDPIEVTDG